MYFKFCSPVIKLTNVLNGIKMANFDVIEKWSPLQFGTLMRNVPLNALRIIFISFLKIIECEYMYLNGYENNFHLIYHTVFMTYHFIVTIMRSGQTTDQRS